jgi:hypothetical protein
MIKKTEERKKRESRTYTPKQMLSGVMNTLFKRGFKETQSHKIIFSYIAHIGGDMNMSLQDACIEIQKDFDAFIRFIREEKPEESKIEVFSDDIEDVDAWVTKMEE